MPMPASINVRHRQPASATITNAEPAQHARTDTNTPARDASMEQDFTNAFKTASQNIYPNSKALGAVHLKLYLETNLSQTYLKPISNRISKRISNLSQTYYFQ